MSNTYRTKSLDEIVDAALKSGEKPLRDKAIRLAQAADRIAATLDKRNAKAAAEAKRRRLAELQRELDALRLEVGALPRPKRSYKLNPKPTVCPGCGRLFDTVQGANGHRNLGLCKGRVAVAS